MGLSLKTKLLQGRVFGFVFLLGLLSPANHLTQRDRTRARGLGGRGKGGGKGAEDKGRGEGRGDVAGESFPPARPAPNPPHTPQKTPPQTRLPPRRVGPLVCDYGVVPPRFFGMCPRPETPRTPACRSKPPPACAPRKPRNHKRISVCYSSLAAAALRKSGGACLTKSGG